MPRSEQLRLRVYVCNVDRDLHSDRVTTRAGWKGGAGRAGGALRRVPGRRRLPDAAVTGARRRRRRARRRRLPGGGVRGPAPAPGGGQDKGGARQTAGASMHCACMPAGPLSGRQLKCWASTQPDPDPSSTLTLTSFACHVRLLDARQTLHAPGSCNLQWSDVQHRAARFRTAITDVDVVAQCFRRYAPPHRTGSPRAAGRGLRCWR